MQEAWLEVFHRVTLHCTLILFAGVIISLVSPTLSVSEGNTGSTSSDFCVQLTNIQSSLLRDVQLLLTTETVAGQAGKNSSGFCLDLHEWW